MPVSSPSMRFGPYEIELEGRSLRKFGYRIRLQPKSFLVLRALLERPGELVTREDLKAQLWPENTFVEFESSLNVAVRRLREALGDEAQNPVYIETVPRAGYRFIGVVEAGSSSDVRPALSLSDIQEAAEESLPAYHPRNGDASSPHVVQTAAPDEQRRSFAPWRMLVPVLALLAAIAVGVFLVRRETPHALVAAGPSIAVLPFADMSPGQEPAVSLRRPGGGVAEPSGQDSPDCASRRAARRSSSRAAPPTCTPLATS